MYFVLFLMLWFESFQLVLHIICWYSNNLFMFPVTLTKIYINQAAGNIIQLWRLQEPVFWIVQYFTEFNRKWVVNCYKGYFSPQIFKKPLILKTMSDKDWIVFINLDLNQNHCLSFIYSFFFMKLVPSKWLLK